MKIGGITFPDMCQLGVLRQSKKAEYESIEFAFYHFYLHGRKECSRLGAIYFWNSFLEYLSPWQGFLFTSSPFMFTSGCA